MCIESFGQKAKQSHRQTRGQTITIRIREIRSSVGANVEQWEKAISAGNSAYAKGLDNQARQHYQAACRRAEQLLPHWLDSEAAVVALMVSYQNLADLNFRQSLCADALSNYRFLYRCLQNYGAENTDNRAIQEIVDRACRRVGVELALQLKSLNLENASADGVIDEIAGRDIRPLKYPNEDHYQ